MCRQIDRLIVKQIQNDIYIYLYIYFQIDGQIVFFFSSIRDPRADTCDRPGMCLGPGLWDHLMVIMVLYN